MSWVSRGSICQKNYSRDLSCGTSNLHEAFACLLSVFSGFKTSESINGPEGDRGLDSSSKVLAYAIVY